MIPLLILLGILYNIPVTQPIKCWTRQSDFLTGCHCRYDESGVWMMYLLNGTYGRDVKFVSEFNLRMNPYNSSCRLYNASSYTIECQMRLGRSPSDFKDLILTATENSTLVGLATFILSPPPRPCDCDWKKLTPNLLLRNHVTSLYLDWVFQLKYIRTSLESHAKVYLNKSGSITNVKNCSNVRSNQMQSCLIPNRYFKGNEPFDICIKIKSRLCYSVHHTCIKYNSIASKLFQGQTISNVHWSINKTKLSVEWTPVNTTVDIFYRYTIYSKSKRLIKTNRTIKTQLSLNLTKQQSKNIQYLTLQFCSSRIQSICVDKIISLAGDTEKFIRDYEKWLLCLLLLPVGTFVIVLAYYKFIKLRKLEERNKIKPNNEPYFVDENCFYVIPLKDDVKAVDADRFKNETDFDKLDYSHLAIGS